MPDYSLFGDEHVRRYEDTAGAVGHDWNDASILIRRTKGRRTGEIRKFPLIYGRSGDDYVIVASKGGDPKHPGWYLNLLAEPDATIQVRDQVIPVHARTAAGDERSRLWQLMVGEWKDYDGYQDRTEREIPVVVLTPEGS